MKAFLELLVDELSVKHEGDLSQLCLVFPTRRAGLFFKKALSEKINTPHWSPVIYSIQDFVRSFSSFVIPDQLTLMFELFEVYKKYFPEEPFEKYYPWGEMLLKDFDEADRSLADTKQLFAYIRDEREIDSSFELAEEDMERIRAFWQTFFNKEPGKLKNEFLANWKHLGNIHMNFRDRLITKNQAYEGLAYRSVAEGLDKNELKADFKKIIFAGFYALSKAEEKIIEHFIQEGKAEIFWDADEYYFDDKKQEAGTFLRNNKLLHPGFKWKQRDFGSSEKNIEIIGVPLQVGQAKLTGNMLNELLQTNGATPGKTAVVLPDENLLFPVLYSLPENVEAFNVTMGYPLSATPLFTLFDSLILLQKNLRKKKDGSITFYHKHVMDVISHPSVQQVESSFIRSWMKQYREEFPWIQIPVDKLSHENAPSLFKNIFRRADKAEDLFGYLKTILQLILGSMKEKEFRFHEIESEYVYHFYVQLKRLEDVVNQYPKQLTLDSFWNLYREIIYSSRIPFSGEPLKGLQVMGFLETRLLDFETVFILSVNEDTLPASSNQASFIPYNIRKGFGLPTYEDQHAVSSYHFYRLLQRAKNIYLLYNTETKSITAGEKSRYLLQIEHELVKKYPEKINLRSRVAATDFVKTEEKVIEVRKTKDVMADLSRYYFKSGQSPEYAPRLSASALSNYISCPLRFYFQYIARIYEKEVTEENIESATFGRILHRAMQLLYGENTNLTSSVFKELEGKIVKAVDVAVREEFRGYDLLEGKNILMRNVMVELVRKILKIDAEHAPVIIRFLEQKYFQPIQISEERAVLLNGIIDRVDEASGYTRIIDYKTGSVDANFQDDFEKVFNDPKYKEQFQVYFYSYLFRKQSSAAHIKSGLLAVKSLSDGIRFVNDGEEIPEDQFREFEDQLTRLINEIFDSEKSFVQTEDVKRCEYCAYKEICHR